MNKVFLSYAHGDAPSAQALEFTLRDQCVSVWRDQQSLYGGQQWPKAIGEALASHDFCLLLWSRNAAASHFVEFEWTTALALRKSILPCLLDDTPLPPALQGIHGIDCKDLHQALPRILGALQGPTPAGAPPAHLSQVISKLGSIGAKEPQQVLGEARMIYAQEGWNVQGNVYQAAGDIHIAIQLPPDQAKAKSKLEPWVKVVGLIAALLAIAIYLFTLSDKIKERFFPNAETTPLRGIIQTIDQEPVADAIVKVDSLPNQSVTTTSDGGFHLPQVPGKPGGRVRVYVSKSGYREHNEYVTLPGPIRITLEKKRK